MSFDGIHNNAVGISVDAEGLLTEQVLARVDDINVDLFVKIVRNGTVYRIDVILREKLGVVGGAVFYGIKIVAEPLTCGGIYIRNTYDLGLGDVGGHMTPSCRGRGEFTSHKSAADDGKAYFLFIHIKTPYYRLNNSSYTIIIHVFCALVNKLDTKNQKSSKMKEIFKL
jgi:hypothetical protein